MDIEERIKNSFGNLKKDISKIKDSINELDKKVISKVKDFSNNADGKIFTAKPYVNSDMLNAVKDVFNSGIFSNGKKVKEFENNFAKFTGAKHAIAVSNGTVAIEIVLHSLDIKKGDEIIVPSYTTMPSIEPIIRVGAKPVFVDIDDSFTIDAGKIEKKITKKTKAIMPVHIYGNSADMGKIKRICEKHKIFLIEDCAQAHNTLYENNHVGTFGDAGCFSFYPTKNITVLGEGGMIITNDDKLAKKARQITNHGEDGRYNHVILGGNSRLSEIHSSIGIEQLKLIDKFTKRRRVIAKIYDKMLKSKKIVLPKENQGARHVYHLYVIRVNPGKRDKIIEELKKDNIFLGIHYPIPCHMQKVVLDKFGKNKLVNTERAVREIISLPTYPGLSDEDAKGIAKRIKELV